MLRMRAVPRRSLIDRAVLEFHGREATGKQRVQRGAGEGLGENKEDDETQTSQSRF